MRAALYARVSTKGQIEGYSLDAQGGAFRFMGHAVNFVVDGNAGVPTLVSEVAHHSRYSNSHLLM